MKWTTLLPRRGHSIWWKELSKLNGLSSSLSATRLSQMNYHDEHVSNSLEPRFDRITVTSTYNRQTKIVPNAVYPRLTNESPSNLNLYCCGPTVYADSHLGHAITYLRCDLIIRVLRKLCNLNVHTAMNITDIDDKIIAKANESGKNYREISHHFYQSFRDDMRALRVQPPDCYLKVLDHIEVICDYIKRLYEKGFAYVSPESGDINFDYEKFLTDYSIGNEMHAKHKLTTEKSRGKKSPKDFALWKVSKEGEPKWRFELNSELAIDGRPGWHVECSALSQLIFGSKLDLHFGGFDLIFPHHHCESCCSHVYQYEPTPLNNKLYASAKVWLHSGHLILRSEKMSKSLGNVILIKDFLQKYPANILRILCLRIHYRSEIDFDEKLLLEMTAYDEKLRELVTLIEFAIYRLSGQADVDTMFLLPNETFNEPEHPLGMMIDKVEQQMWRGVLDDFDLNAGLDAMMELAQVLSAALPTWLHTPEKQSQMLFEFIRLRSLMRRWIDATGLDYGLDSATAVEDQLALVDHLSNFRAEARKTALETLKSVKKTRQSGQVNLEIIEKQAQKMLEFCDQTRQFLDQRGIKLKDQLSSSSSTS